MEKTMFTSGAAKALGLGVSTLRNYAVILESKGYTFERGSNNGRIFKEEDLERIKEMIDRIAEDSLTVDQAAGMIAAAYGNREVNQADVEAEPEQKLEIGQLFEKIALLEEQHVKMAEANQNLATQVERLTEKMEERERDQALFERMENARNKKKRKGMAFLRSLTFSDKNTI